MADQPIIPSDAVQAIKDSVKTEIITIEDREFVTRPVFDVPQSAEAKPIELHTLQGVVSYLKSHLDAESMQGAAVQICGPKTVHVISGLFGTSRQREKYAVSKCESLFNGEFKFGQYMDCETFIIGLRTLFVQTSGAEDVVKLVGTLTQVAEKTDADDGFTQTVNHRTGITREASAQVANPVMLTPFRTFREVDQPESAFILRLKGGDKPQCALFEADGGQWILTAINSIKWFFDGEELGIPIIY